MSPELPQVSNTTDVFQSVWYKFALLFATIEIIVFWLVFGPSSPWAGLAVVSGTFALGPVIARPIMRRIPNRWFQVRAGERVLHRFAGVGIFGWVLDVSGWNRNVANPMRGFSGNRAGLLSLEQSLRCNASAHGACFLIHVLLAAIALFSEHPWSAALWMLLPGVAVHLYPVLLQRSIMLRLQPVIENSSRRAPNKTFKRDQSTSSCLLQKAQKSRQHVLAAEEKR